MCKPVKRQSTNLVTTDQIGRYKHGQKKIYILENNGNVAFVSAVYINDRGLVSFNRRVYQYSGENNITIRVKRREAFGERRSLVASIFLCHRNV